MLQYVAFHRSIYSMAVSVYVTGYQEVGVLLQGVRLGCVSASNSRGLSVSFPLSCRKEEAWKQVSYPSSVFDIVSNVSRFGQTLLLRINVWLSEWMCILRNHKQAWAISVPHPPYPNWCSKVSTYCSRPFLPSRLMFRYRPRRLPNRHHTPLAWDFDGAFQ